MYVVACEARKQGEWGRMVLERCISWREHLVRALAWPRASWAARMLATDSVSWLARLRAEHNSSVFGGRTGTRAIQGPPHPRWVETVARARA